MYVVFNSKNELFMFEFLGQVDGFPTHFPPLQQGKQPQSTSSPPTETLTYFWLLFRLATTRYHSFLVWLSSRPWKTLLL